MIALLVGGVGAVCLTLWAGRASGQPLLMAIMSLWVVSPFVLIAIAGGLTASRRPAIRATLHRVAPLLVVASIAIYAVAAFAPRGTRTTPVFVLVPPISWTTIAIAALIRARTR